MSTLGLLLGLLFTVFPSNPLEGLTMTWQDPFNNWKNAWSTREVAHVEGQCARGDRRCARTHDGEMILSVQHDPENPGLFLAGHVGTQHRKEFAPFGFYEARIAFPAAPGVLCGWWITTTEDYIPGQAEIDIAENGGRRAINHTIWYRDPGQLAGQFHLPPPTLTTDLGSRDAQTEFHDYGVLWTPAAYVFYIDRQPVGVIAEGLSDRPKFLVLSIKIPDYLRPVFDPDLIREYKMRIRWLRVYQ